MKIVLLCSEGDSSAIVYNALKKHYKIDKIIVEDDVPRKTFLKRRIKKLGFFKVLGQIAFSVGIVPFLKRKSKKRKAEIVQENGLDLTANYLADSQTVRVSSANSVECINVLKEVNPDIVVVNGTRILTQEVLDCVNATFINMHAGITPKYRGVHGAYWALCNKDYENVGVTVHLVDKGIDTGNIIYQSKISISEKDNFCTYPLLQTAAGVQDELKAIEDIANNQLKTQTNNLPSKLYSHPTMWQYLRFRMKYKVK